MILTLLSINHINVASAFLARSSSAQLRTAYMPKIKHIRTISIGLVDLFLILLSTEIASYISGKTANAMSHYTGPTFFSVTAYMLFMYVFELYSLEVIKDKRESFFRIIWSLSLGFITTGFIFYLLGHWQYPLAVFLIQLFLSIIFIGIWRRAYITWLHKSIRHESALIIGTHDKANAVRDLLEKNITGFSLKGFISREKMTASEAQTSLPVLGSIDDLDSCIKTYNIQHIILTDTWINESTLHQKLLHLRLNGIRIHNIISLYELYAFRIPASYIKDQWILFETGFDIICFASIKNAKRVVDIVSASALLMLTSPLLALTAIAIKMDSSGPVFFKQTRVGLNNKPFIIYKFRSMHTDAESGKAIWAKHNDPRITRIGRFLRQLRIDEIPQLVNVIKGDMSLIGPRPEQPEFVEKLKVQLPYYYIRHLVRPGITGWAQVNYKYGSSVEDSLRKLEYELYYIKNMSVFLEIKILLKTIGVILFRKGAR
jgi:sugar transferase (PEP-CTERM system associated)